MSRGFLLANIDVNLLADPKMLKLARLVPEEGERACTILVYLQTVLQSWHDGRRLTVEEAEGLWAPTLDRIEADRAALERHRASLAPPVEDEPVDVDLLIRLCARLDAGLSDQERQEVVRLLVGRISISTIINDDGTKDATAVMGYRSPGALSTRSGTGSWRR